MAGIFQDDVSRCPARVLLHLRPGGWRAGCPEAEGRSSLKQGGKNSYDRMQATLALDAPVTTVRLVSPQRAAALGKLGITTVRDLLSNFPRRYVDMSQVRSIRDALPGNAYTIRALVHEVVQKGSNHRNTRVEITLVDGTGTVIVTAFNQPWLANQLHAGDTVAASGLVEFRYGYKRMTNPHIEHVEGETGETSGLILAVHPLTGSIKAGMMRRLVANALDSTRGVIDPMPLTLRSKYRLMSRRSALECIHFPKTMPEQNEARRRLAYEEVLLLQLAMMQDGASRSEGRLAVEHVVNGPHSQALEAAVPFALTDEQGQARNEIAQRLEAPRAANHMLLGDVGTGKTIVSAFALAAAADTGTQALFMAPTEVLARQHAASLGPLLEEVGISSDVLTGSTAPAERESIVERLANGQITVLFGTHALLEDDVRPVNMTLAVIDEQQRFGVDQRASLLAKGECPDALFLTATPIPRTLALALFGNLTLSYLKHRPRALEPRKTFVHPASSKGVAYDAAQAALKRGEQVYVVCPLVGDKKSASKQGAGDDALEVDDYAYGDIAIEEERDMRGGNVAAAEAEASFLQGKVFVDHVVGLLHGKLSSSEKQQTMERFRAGEIDVLVATTVIEVGVDVPNATVMIVEDADRFGLSQLHQLRGRVGRGNLPGEVHLISGSKAKTALARLAALERTDDGFELATYDLSLRREGDILGNRQHGASMLKLVNVVRDGGLIEAAHCDAERILEEDPQLESDLYRPLGRETSLVFRRSMEISGG